MERSMANVVMFLLLLWNILNTCVLAAHTGSIYLHDLPDRKYKKLGHINLGILVPVHYYTTKGFCGETVRDMGVLQRVEALAYAVDEINNRSDILPDHTLGFVMFDDCYKDVTALAQSLHFIEKNDTGICYRDLPEICTNGTLETYEVVGLIGSESSTTTAQVANLFTSFQVPQISYLATSDSLSDRDKYPFFVRTVPTDTKQAIAIAEVLDYFNWTYVSVVYAEGDYGAEGFKVLQRQTKRRKICIAVEYEIKKGISDREYQLLVIKLMMESDATVVVVYTPLEEARKILQMAHRLSIKHITWIASDAWARDLNDVMDLDVKKPGYLPLNGAAVGALSFNIVSGNVLRFDKYFRDLSPGVETGNPWLHEFWEDYLKCTTKSDRLHLYPPCDPDLRFINSSHYIPDNLVSLVFDTVYTIAHGLHAVIVSGACSSQPAEQFLRCIEAKLSVELPRVSFEGETAQVRFQRDGSVDRSYKLHNIQRVKGRNSSEKEEFQFVHVATWNETTRRLSFTSENIQWVSGTPPESLCSRPCMKAEQQTLQQKRCCWVCEKCADNQYTDIWRGYNLQKCYDCPRRTWPDQETRTDCLPIKPDYLKWNDTLGFILALVASIGIISCILTAVIFAINNDNPLIKASSRELSYLMLLGIFMSYIFIFCFLLKPSDKVCFLRLMGFSMCFSLMYAPLMTKTMRIYRIFDAGRRMNRKPTCVSSKSQFGIAINIILSNMFLVGGWSFGNYPQAIEFDIARDKVELICHLPLGPFIASLSYNSLLLLACVYCAFKTRKLPDNYNESRFISFCVYSTVIIWLTFIPAYFAVGKAFFEVMFLSLAVLANASLILMCIFVPKIYALYFVKKEDLHVSAKFQNRGGARRLVDDNRDISSVHSSATLMEDTHKHTSDSSFKSEYTTDQTNVCNGATLRMTPPTDKRQISPARDNPSIGTQTMTQGGWF